MIPGEDALRLVAKFTPPSTVVNAQVNGALVGSVLAKDVTAPESVPAYRASIVDGYAVSKPF